MTISSFRCTLLVLLFGATWCAAQPVDPQAVLDVDYLASFNVRGRGYYHGGHDSAAHYIRARFAALGLQSLGDDYYLQRFPIRVNEFPGNASLLVAGRQLRVGVDWLPNDLSGSGDPVDPKPIHVGSGLMIPDKGVNEYEGRNVRGRIVVMEDTVPKKWAADTSIDREYLSEMRRILIAQELGASGVVILQNNLTAGKRDDAFSIPVADVRRSVWPRDIATMTLKIESRVMEMNSHNVVGLLKGTGDTDSLIMICAHYDHLGGIGDSVYFPGANDNAGGTAILMSLARYFRDHPLRYSILFVAFSGEEAGLVGSQFFVKNPLVDLKNVRFLLNMDMTASGREGVMAVCGEEFKPEFEAFRAAAESLGVQSANVRKRPNAPNSDHYPFVRAGVRGFYIYPFTGQQPYHSVNDRPATLEWDVWDRMRGIAIGLLERL